jgi:hypothetical protein
MTGERPAPRFAAQSFPEIQGIRLVPPGAPATLVNLSATGVLVECESRLLPDRAVTVEIAGTFSPSSIQGRVTRCEVIGITASGSLGYRIGLAFNTRITLPNGDEATAAVPPAAPASVPAVAAPDAVPTPPVLRNRW